MRQKNPFRSPVLMQASFLSSASAVFLFLGVIPRINIVINTYAVAAMRFIAGTSPYLPPQAGAPLDQYKYSPLFAMFFAGLLRFARHLPIGPGLAIPYLWISIGIFVFWLGVCRWIDFGEIRTAGMGLALLGCFVELDTSLWYCQANALIVGIMLLGLAEFRDRRAFSAGMILAAGAGLKVLPGIFVLALFFRGGTRFRSGVLLGAIAVILAPAFFIGLGRDFSYHSQWMAVLFRDATGPGRLDLASALAYYNLPLWGLWLRRVVFVATISSLLLAFYRREVCDEAWIAVGLTGLLLCSPRTEQPTFVLVAPVYLFLAKRMQEKYAWVSLAPAIYFISLRAWRLVAPALPNGEYKTFGTLALWGVAWSMLSVPILRETLLAPCADSAVHRVNIGIAHLLKGLRSER